MPQKNAVEDRKLRPLIYLATKAKMCRSCGKTVRMYPDEVQCSACTEDGMGPADFIAHDTGWRR